MTAFPAKTFHSFRHLFVAMLRAAEASNETINALAGSANKDVTAGYGKIKGAIFPIEVLQKAVERICISGLDLSYLHARS